MVEASGGEWQPYGSGGPMPPPPPMPWPGGNMPPPGGPQARNGLGTAALILGILSLPGIFTVIGGVVLGVLAVIFGVIGMRRAKRGEATNGGLAIAGLVTGAVGVLGSIAIVAIGASFFFAHQNQITNYTQCIQHATTSQARAACANRFSQQLHGG